MINCVLLNSTVTYSRMSLFPSSTVQTAYKSNNPARPLFTFPEKGKRKHRVGSLFAYDTRSVGSQGKHSLALPWVHTIRDIFTRGKHYTGGWEGS